MNGMNDDRPEREVKQWYASRCSWIKDARDPNRAETAMRLSIDALIDAAAGNRVGEVEVHAIDDAHDPRLTEFLTDNDRKGMHDLLRDNEHAVVFIATCATNEPTPDSIADERARGHNVDIAVGELVKCPICDRRLFGDVALRGVCFGCVPATVEPE